MKDNTASMHNGHDEHDTKLCKAEDKRKGGDNMLNGLVWNDEKSGLLDGIADVLSPYSDREIRVAELSSEGKSNEEIARILNMKPQHVSDIQREILAKARACMRGC